MFFTYVLFSRKDGMLYVGSTKDLENRFKLHEAGDVKATSYRRPLKLIYYEAYLTEKEARRREEYLKGGNGRQQLKVQLKLTLKDLDYRFLDNE